MGDKKYIHFASMRFKKERKKGLINVSSVCIRLGFS